MFEEAVATVGLRPVLRAADDTGPEVFPAQRRLGAVLPVARLDEAELAARLRRVVGLEAELAAYKAELVVALAGRRPDALDVPAGEPGAASESWAAHTQPVLGRVSEFFCDELALILNVSRAEATRLTDTAAMLVDHLPATRAALADGELDWPRARAIAAELRPTIADTPPAVLAAVETAVLPRAGELSITRLKAAVRCELLARHGLVAEARRLAAEKLADVTVRRSPEAAADGMAQLVADLPAPVAAAVRETVDTYARMLKADGDPRPIGQLRALVLADLVLRPWDTSRPPVTAVVHLTAPATALQPIALDEGEAAPVGEVDGTPITAGQVRELLERLDALCPGGLQEPAGGSIGIDFTDPDTGELQATADLLELQRIAKRGCTRHSEAGVPGCTCSVLGKPPPTDRYSPTPAQRRFVQARDRTCRMPGCHNRVGRTDIDHARAHADGGETACENLCCLCRRHHRLKTHTKDWVFALDPDGTLHVTTPTGVTRTTRPPGWHLLIPPPPPDPDDDPPPF